MSLSVVMNTRNTADTLKQSLESVAGIADEIIIVDMESEDDTLKIAREYTNLVFSYKNAGYVEPARNFALTKATKDWILVLDSDEELTPELREFLVKLSRDEVQSGPSAYAVPRKNLVFGAWMRKAGWWPDYQLRIFRRGSVKWSEQIHSLPEVDGETAQLPDQENVALLHHNYHSIEQFLEKLNRYTTHEVSSRTPKKKITGGSVVAAFKTELLNRLFKHQGIDDGVHGVGVSFLQSLYEVSVTLKQWQAEKFPHSADDQRETFRELRSLQQQLSYWIADWQVQHTQGVIKFYWMLRRRFQV